MVFKYLIGLTCLVVSVVSVSANAAVVYWEPTNTDVNFTYTTTAGFDLGIFDVDDFDTAQANPLMLNTAAAADTIVIAASTGGNFSATSSVTSNSTTLLNDNQFVLAITDGTSWFEPVSWFEIAANSNIFNITFSNGIVTSIDAVPTVVPVPAAAFLLGSGLIGLIGFAKRKKA